MKKRAKIRMDHSRHGTPRVCHLCEQTRCLCELQPFPVRDFIATRRPDLQPVCNACLATMTITFF